MKMIGAGQQGFTLVEILIAVAILAVLSAIAVPTVGTIMSSSNTKADKGELANIQAALDAMMADNELETVTVVSSGTNVMSSFPDGTNPLFSGYLRTATTSCSYTVASDGLVAQPSCP